MINIFSSSRYKIRKSGVERFTQEVLDRYHVDSSSILNVAFVGKRKMRDVASTYKNEDVALPVLSFTYINDPENNADNIIGEVVICYPQAVLLAAEREKKVDDMIFQLIEHGIQNIFSK